MTEASKRETPRNGGGAESAAAMAERAKDQAAEAVTRVQDGFDDAVAKGSEELKRLSDHSAKFVRDNPGLAVAGAVGLGVLIGLAIRPRH